VNNNYDDVILLVVRMHIALRAIASELVDELRGEGFCLVDQEDA
jgi:hypothetical protein